MDDDDLDNCLTQPEFLRQVEMAEKEMLRRQTNPQRIDDENCGRNFKLSNKNVRNKPLAENIKPPLLQTNTTEVRQNNIKVNQMEGQIEDLTRQLNLSRAETKNVRLSLAAERKEKEKAFANCGTVERSLADWKEKYRDEKLRLQEHFNDQQHFLVHDMTNLNQKLEDQKIKYEQLKANESTTNAPPIKMPKSTAILPTRPCRAPRRSKEGVAETNDFLNSQSFNADIRENAMSSTLITEPEMNNLPPQQSSQVAGPSTTRNAGPSVLGNQPTPRDLFPFSSTPRIMVASEAQTEQMSRVYFKFEEFIDESGRFMNNSGDISLKQVLCDVSKPEEEIQ